MAFKIPFESRHRIEFKKRHLTDETIQSYYGGYDVIKIVTTRCSLGGKIEPAQFMICRSESEYGSRYAYQAIVGGKRDPWGRNTFTLSRSFFIEMAMEKGVTADGRKGEKFRIAPKDCKEIIEAVKLLKE